MGKPLVKQAGFWLAVAGGVGAVALAGLVAAIVVRDAFAARSPSPATPTASAPQPAPAPKAEPTRAKAVPTGKPAEPLKVDPWEDARAHFKKVKEIEKEATKKRLNDLDRTTELKMLSLMNATVGLAAPADGDVTIGELLWLAGLEEHVASFAAPLLDDKTFRRVFDKLNPDPTAREIVNGAIRYSISHGGFRQATVDMILGGEDTRTFSYSHRMAKAWTGK